MKLENLDPIPLEAPPLDKHLSESDRAFGPPLTTVQKMLHDVLPLDPHEPLAKSVRPDLRIGQPVRDTDGAIGVLTGCQRQRNGKHRVFEKSFARLLCERFGGNSLSSERMNR